MYPSLFIFFSHLLQTFPCLVPFSNYKILKANLVYKIYTHASVPAARDCG